MRTSKRPVKLVRRLKKSRSPLEKLLFQFALAVLICFMVLITSGPSSQKQTSNSPTATSTTTDCPILLHQKFSGIYGLEFKTEFSSRFYLMVDSPVQIHQLQQAVNLQTYDQFTKEMDPSLKGTLSQFVFQHYQSIDQVRFFEGSPVDIKPNARSKCLISPSIN